MAPEAKQADVCIRGGLRRIWRGVVSIFKAAFGVLDVLEGIVFVLLVLAILWAVLAG